MNFCPGRFTFLGCLLYINTTKQPNIGDTTMTAAEAKELVKASSAMKASEEVASQCIKQIDKLIEEAAKKGETQIIISSGCDKSEAASLYHHPTRWNSDADYEHVENIVKTYLTNSGFSTYSYYNGLSHLRIMW